MTADIAEVSLYAARSFEAVHHLRYPDSTWAQYIDDIRSGFEKVKSSTAYLDRMALNVLCFLLGIKRFVVLQVMKTYIFTQLYKCR